MPSYCTIEEANEYFASRLFVDVWESADEATKEKALAMATRKIDRIPFKGKKAIEYQENAFPRCFKYYNAWGSYWDCQIEVPEAIKVACCEEARAILSIGDSARLELQQQGVQSYNLSGMAETFKPGAGKGLLSQEAKELLAFYKTSGVGFA